MSRVFLINRDNLSNPVIRIMVGMPQKKLRAGLIDMSSALHIRAFGKMMLAFMLMAIGMTGTIAQQTTAKCHVLMLDVSGSMKHRYDNNLKGWLVEKLITSAAFSPSDRVIVRWFDQRGNATFSPNDPQRRYDGKHDPAMVLARVPAANQAVGLNTDLPEALELTLGDIRGLSVSGDVLVWLVTDNEQDVGGQGTVDPLYQKIKSEQAFRAGYIFPLVKENGSMLPPSQSALVMYLLHYSAQKSSLAVNRLADDAGKKIGNEPVTWYPFEQQINLDKANVTVNSEPTKFVDGKLELPPVQEGTPPEFAIQFRLNSELRGREIQSGRIARPVVALDQVPETLAAEGEGNSWSADISPTAFALKPKQSSLGTYSAVVRGNGIAFHPASFWSAVWDSTSDPIDASLQFTPADLKTKMDVRALSTVKNLASIESVVQQGQNSKNPIRIPMTFRVEFNSLWRRAVAGLLFAVVLGGAGSGACLLFLKSRYQLVTPGGERVLALPLIGSESITIGHDQAAVISKRPGKLMVAAASGFALEGGAVSRRLNDRVDSFAIANQQDGRTYSYSISRLSKPSQGTTGRDTILD